MNGSAVDKNECLCNIVEGDVAEIMLYTQQAVDAGIHQPLSNTEYSTLDQPNPLPPILPLVKFAIETDPASINEFDFFSETMVVEDLILTSIPRVKNRESRATKKELEVIDSSSDSESGEVDPVPETLFSYMGTRRVNTRTLGQMTLKDMEEIIMIERNPLQESKYRPAMAIRTIQENESASKMKVKRLLNNLKSDPLNEIRRVFLSV